MDENYGSDGRGIPQQLRLLGLFLAAIVGVLLVSYWLMLRSDYSVLYESMSEDDAALVVEHLRSEGERYRLSNGGTTISVPSSKVDDIRLTAIGSEATLRNLSGFELFDSSAMGLTDFDQRVKYQRALQGELARTILMMDDIERVRVHIAIPEKSAFRTEQKIPSAAVAVSTRVGRPLDRHRVEGIRRLVAASVPELELSQVVVLDGQGEVHDYVEGAAVSPSENFRAEASSNRAIGGYERMSMKAPEELIRRVLEVAYPEDQIEVILTPLTRAELSAGLYSRMLSSMWSAIRVLNVPVEVRLVTRGVLTVDKQAKVAELVSDVLPAPYRVEDSMLFLSLGEDAGVAPVTQQVMQSGPSLVERVRAGAQVIPASWRMGGAVLAITLLGFLGISRFFRRELSKEEREVMALRLGAALTHREEARHAQ